MISLDLSRVSTEKVGGEHGLDLKAAFSEYRDALRNSVENLYGKKDEVGAWKRWLNLGYDDKLAKDILSYAQPLKGKFTDLVVLGIGGSSLGGFALLRALLHPYWNNLSDKQRNGYPRFHFVENVDSDQMAGLLEILDPKTTLVNVISKSGTTAETMSAFMLFKTWLEKGVGADKAKDHVVATTDAKTGILRGIVETEGYASFEVPDDVGGRFSIFCAVGLLPAALCGVDIKAMQAGIRELDKACQNPDVDKNPAAQGALIQYLLYEKGKPISVFMPYSFRLSSVSDWYVQLWAESLGKKLDKDGRTVHVGPTPVRAVGVTDQHSQVQLFKEGPNDKVVTFVRVEKPDTPVTIPPQFETVEDLAYLGNKTFHQLLDAEFESTRSSLTVSQRPNVTITLPKLDAAHFAQLLYLLEVQTAIAGDLFNIDPFDQPGVELAKKYTHALMGRKGFEQLIPEAKGQTPAPISG